MVKNILIGIGLVIGVILLAAAVQPSDYRIERKAIIHANAGKVFSLVNDSRKVNEWSPWAKIDPNAKMVYEGPARGKGAVTKWAGNHEVGEGKLTIVESMPNQKVVTDLEFIKPFAGKASAEMLLKRVSNRETEVTWAMYGKNDYMGKLMSLIMNCEKMIGGQYEKGLANLDALASK